MTDPMELVGRLEKRGRTHRARASGLQKRIDAGDRSVSIQDPQNAIREAETDEKAAACIREMVEAQTELSAAARAYFVGWMMDEADDSGPEYTGCSIEQHLAAKRLGEALPPAPGAEA